MKKIMNKLKYTFHKLQKFIVIFNYYLLILKQVELLEKSLK